MAIKPSKKIHSEKIKPIPISNSFISFSFQHLDNISDKFTINECELNYFKSVLERLKSISTFKIGEFTTNNSKAIRSHSIKWEETTESEGFICLNQTIRDYANQVSFQFEITANEHGRIHGFILENIFYVIWFDPFHKLYI